MSELEREDPDFEKSCSMADSAAMWSDIELERFSRSHFSADQSRIFWLLSAGWLSHKKEDKDLLLSDVN